MFELIWLRSFGGLFGASAPALAATIAGVFAGMALGSACFGRIAARLRDPRAAWALLELGVGVGGLLALATVGLYRRFAGELVVVLDDVPGAALAARTTLVFLAVLPAAFAMGGTLPLAVAWAERRGVRASAGRLYAFQLAGAVLGALAVPFLLLPLFGARACAWIAAGSALALALLIRSALPASGAARAQVPTTGAGLPARSLLVHALAFAGGLLGLGLEVLWARMLAQVHQGSLHSIGVVLALFLFALALGAALAGWLLRGGREPWRALSACWAAAGLTTIATPILFVSATGGLEYLEASSAAGYLGQLVGLGVLTFFLPTVLAGVGLPMLFVLAGSQAGSRVARVGSLLAASTAGAICGPLLVTFLAFRVVGVWGTAVLLGAGFIALSLVAGSAGGSRRALPFRVALLLVAALLGAFAVARPRVHFVAEAGEELIWIEEGSHGIVSVVRSPAGKRLKLDNFYTLGGDRSAGDDRLLGHLPLLLHEDPRRVAFLGLGTGITASAAVLHPELEEVLVFELVREVARAAAACFGEVNLALFADQRVRLVTDDARVRMRALRGELDVVIGDLVVPWRHGEADLFTREHFAGVRDALAPGGLYCQWLPLYQMTAEEFGIVAATFVDVFGEALVWRGDFAAEAPTMALVARAGAAPLDPARIDRRVEALASALAVDQRYLIHPLGLWMHLVGTLDARTPWLAALPLNTDDRPRLELLSARNHAAGQPRAGSLFVAGRLLGWIEALGAPQPRGSLAQLGPAQLDGADVGADLFRASCLSAAGESERARGLAFASIARMPEAIQVRFFGATRSAGAQPPEDE